MLLFLAIIELHIHTYDDAISNTYCIHIGEWFQYMRNAFNKFHGIHMDSQ